MPSEVDRLKRQAAEYAVRFVTSGMVVGLGHGSTAYWAVRKIGALLRDGTLTGVLGIPCSRRVEHDAHEFGIPLTSLDEHPVIDLTIDGADEVDGELNVIKGGGGALLREKIVAQASRRELIVIDDSKLSPVLGRRARLPVEVVPFGWRTQAAYIESLDGRWTMRQGEDGTPFHTDQGNCILDCDFGDIADQHGLAQALQSRAGIAAHGLFIGFPWDIIVATSDGVRVMRHETNQ